MLSYIVGAPTYAALREAGGEPADVEAFGRRRVARPPHRDEGGRGRPKDKLMATEYRVLSDELRAPRDDVQ